MNIKNLFIATVIQNNATSKSPLSGTPGQTGEVQIKIDWLHREVIPTNLPWARPITMGTGGGPSQGIGMVPEIGSKIWVFSEKPDISQNWYYIGDAQHTINPFTIAAVKAALGGISGTYPDVKFLMLKNGVIVGATSSLTAMEVFAVIDAGTSFLMSKTKGFKLKQNLNEFSMTAAGVKLKNATNSIELNPIGITIKAPSGTIQLGKAATSFVTTMNGHGGVVDTITGTPIVTTGSNVMSVP